MREAPTRVTSAHSKTKTKAYADKGPKGSARLATLKNGPPKEKKDRPSMKKHYNPNSDSEDESRNADAERRMKAVVRAQGKLTKKGGSMISSGVSEFQIMAPDYLEKMASR